MWPVRKKKAVRDQFEGREETRGGGGFTLESLLLPSPFCSSNRKQVQLRVSTERTQKRAGEDEVAVD